MFVGFVLMMPIVVAAQQSNLVFMNQITGKSTGIQVKSVDSSNYFALNDLLLQMEWELELDYAEGMIRSHFRDMEFRFADGVSGYYRSGEYFRTQLPFRLEQELLWAPYEIIESLLIPAWGGDLVWDPTQSELRLMKTLDSNSPQESVASTGSDQAIVVIDAGHGGEDFGFTLSNGKLEKELTRKLAEKTSRLLADRMGADVLLTRNGDFMISEIERAMIANRAHCDLFLSIHLVSTHEIAPKGFILYTRMPTDSRDSGTAGLSLWDRVEPASVQKSGDYAARFGDALSAAANGVLWQIQPMSLKLLEGIASPALVVELGTSLAFYGDVPIDQDDGLNRAAEALYDGIQRALEMGKNNGI